MGTRSSEASVGALFADLFPRWISSTLTGRRRLAHTHAVQQAERHQIGAASNSATSSRRVVRSSAGPLPSDLEDGLLDELKRLLRKRQRLAEIVGLQGKASNPFTLTITESVGRSTSFPAAAGVGSLPETC